jgi:hypothetical protein
VAREEVKAETTTMNIGHDRLQPFQYDPPDRRRTRLFQLDLNGENEPLSGKVISFLDEGFALSNFDIKGYIKSFHEWPESVLRKLSGSNGYDALSWVWGPAENEQPLYLATIGHSLDENGDVDLESGRDRNGCIYIRPPLREFLKECRRRQYKRFLWM